MRPLVLALAALVASGCVVYETRPYQPPPPTDQPAPPAQGERLMSEQEAAKVALDAARQRGLEVDRVQRARLDAKGRWHVDVRGRGDRALVLIDARSGRLLKGRFRETGDREDGAPDERD